MKYSLTILISLLIIQNSVAPPVDQKKKEESENEIPNENLADVMEYHRYLQEVVQALESDAEFRKKLENTDESEIRSGQIAHELEYVSHNVRTKLDELKRQELERLRHLATREFELENGLDPRHMKIPEHVDHTNPHTFEIDDLKKLIAKTTKDLDEADKQRREEFKEYEMHKKFEQEEKMKNMTVEDKTKFENELHELEKKHKEHEPLHHPGSKKQYEEVWEKQDHMENQEFDPKTFFHLHDLDGNGVWDPTELKALFLKELDKLYTNGAPEDDLVERAEEMERMREHVIKEADLNKDGLISYDEFLAESKKAEFQQDPGWEPLDEQQIYSEQEYEEYKRQKAKEIERHIAKGMSQEYPAGQPHTGQQQFPPHPNQIHQDYMQQQGHFQQVPPQQYYPQQGQYGNQIPQQGQYNQMPPQHGQYPNQMPQQQYQQQQYHPNQQVPVQHINQVPQQQNYPSPNQQMPPQQFQQPPNNNQVPQQQYQQPINTNQIPQQQFQQPINTNQIPQQQFQQPINTNQVPQQPINTNQVPQQQFQQPINTNQIPQQQYQQQPNANQVPQQPSGQNPPPVANNLNQPPPPVQQNQPAGDQNQQNTQNQIPQQTHEQQAPNTNAQAH